MFRRLSRDNPAQQIPVSWSFRLYALKRVIRDKQTDILWDKQTDN